MPEIRRQTSDSTIQMIARGRIGPRLDLSQDSVGFGMASRRRADG